MIMDEAITTQAISKRYERNSRWRRSRGEAPIAAVQDVSLNIARGELFGLLGPNGAGKTTLVKMLCTLIVPTSGSAQVGGHDLGDDQAIKANSGLVVSDERSFYWRLSTWRNLQFFAALHGLFGPRASARVTAVLQDVGLADRAEQRFSDLSSGMRQRLAIARALLHEPDILFLDEPTRSLDPVATAAMHTLIKSLQAKREMTILLITHDLREAEKMCGRVALMHEGRIQATGAPHDLRRQLDPRRRYLISLSNLPPAAEAAAQRLVPDMAIERPQGPEGRAQLRFTASEQEPVLTQLLDILRGYDLEVRNIEGGPPSLEDVFAHYTTVQETEQQ